MKKEFGPRLKAFYMPLHVNDRHEAEEALKIAEV